MNAAAATEIIAKLEEIYPRMTSDGYKASLPLTLAFVEKGALGSGTHARYATGHDKITFAGLDQATDQHALDTITHEYAHAVLDKAYHQCPRFRKTAGHCSHFVATHKDVARRLAQGA